MNKGKVARLAGFVGALGLSTVLVTTAVQGTGAWFSDTSDGSISATSGHLKLLTKKTDDPSSTYKQGRTHDLTYDLMPGTPGSHTIGYQVDVTSGGVDLWLVFTGTDAEYNEFTGGLDNASGSDSTGGDGGLGRFGYFSVQDSAGWGTAFVSGNLSFPYADSNGGKYNDTQAAGNCSTNADNGRGGDPTVYKAGPPTVQPGWCGVPKQILIHGNLASGDSGTVTVSFGLNGDKTTQQDQVHFASLPYQLVATQAGQTP